MIRSSSRTLIRQSISPIRSVRVQRFLSTAPPAQKSRSWKSSTLRWGLAIGGLYYYNTTNVFADEPAHSIPTSSLTDENSLPTLESISASRQSKVSLSSPENSPALAPGTSHNTEAIAEPGSLDEVEEEASQEGAFNEETGEINWDCPCLGGMAHGPCGEQFRAAFSCFVYSKDEPKGMDCVDHFKTMQSCFREHPDVYGDELASDDEPEEYQQDPETQEIPHPSGASAPAAAASTTPPSPLSTTPATIPHDDQSASKRRAKTATGQVRKDYEPQSEIDAMVPKAAHDDAPSTT